MVEGNQINSDNIYKWNHQACKAQLDVFLSNWYSLCGLSARNAGRTYNDAVDYLFQRILVRPKCELSSAEEWKRSGWLTEGGERKSSRDIARSSTRVKDLDSVVQGGRFVLQETGCGARREGEDLVSVGAGFVVERKKKVGRRRGRLSSDGVKKTARSFSWTCHRGDLWSLRQKWMWKSL